MPNYYVDFNMSPAGGNGSITTPWSATEWAAALTTLGTMPNIVFHIRGKYEFSSNLTSSITNSSIQAWGAAPWRLKNTGTDFIMAGVAISEGIIFCKNVTVASATDCFIEATAGSYDQTGDTIERCTFRGIGPSSSSFIATSVRVDIVNCVLMNDASQMLYSDVAGSTISDSYTNLIDATDLFLNPANWAVGTGVVFGRDIVVAPEYDETNLLQYRYNAPVGFGPVWAITNGAPGVAGTSRFFLSSIRRLRAHVMGIQSPALSTSTNNDRMLWMWLQAASNAIERYCDREFQLKSRTQYFDIKAGQRYLYIKAPDITTLTSVYTDATGLWDGSNESEIADCIPDGSRVILPYAFDYNAPKALRVIYTGGLATYPVYTEISATEYDATTNKWLADKYVISTNGAVGVIVSVTLVAGNTTTLLIEDYYGAWNMFGDQGITDYITQYDDEAGTTPTVPPAEGYIQAAITTSSLAQEHPAIVMACDALVRYWWKHTTDFENTGSSKDGSSIRRDMFTAQEWPLTPEVRQLLAPYVRTACL